MTSADGKHPEQNEVATFLAALRVRDGAVNLDDTRRRLAEALA